MALQPQMAVSTPGRRDTDDSRSREDQRRSWQDYAGHYLAITYANTGKDVLLVDGDDQHRYYVYRTVHRASWHTRLCCCQPSGNGLAYPGAPTRTQYDDIIIDVGGRDTGSLRAAITVAQTLLIPLQPRSFDIWAVDQMAELVKETREISTELRALAVLNAADAQGKDNADAGKALKEVEGITLLPVIIRPYRV